jgi:PKD repeat protein
MARGSQTSARSVALGALAMLMVTTLLPGTGAGVAGAQEPEPTPDWAVPGSVLIPVSLHVAEYREVTNAEYDTGECYAAAYLVFDGDTYGKPWSGDLVTFFQTVDRGNPGEWGQRKFAKKGPQNYNGSGTFAGRVDYDGDQYAHLYGSISGYGKMSDGDFPDKCSPQLWDANVAQLKAGALDAWLWTEGPVAVPPTVDFTSDRSDDEPGVVSFDSEVTNGQIGPFTYAWDFGDGGTSAAADPTYTYALPGTYDVKVTVTDFEGRSGTRTKQVEVPSPMLGVALEFPEAGEVSPGIPDMRFAVGEEVPVKVHLKTTEGLGNLTNVGFVGMPLTVSPSDAFSVSKSPDPAELEGLVLEPRNDENDNDEIVLDYELVAEKPGSVTFKSTAVATDAAERLVGPTEVERNGRIGELEVKVIATPNDIELSEADDESGPEPKPVKVKVEVTNPFDQPVDPVVLEVFNPQLVTEVEPPLGYKAFKYLEDPDPDPDDGEGEPGEGEGEGEPGEGEELPDGPVGDQPPDVELGAIGAGETVTQEFDGLALRGGDVDLQFLARGSFDGRNVTGAGTTRLQIRSDVMFEFDAEIDPTSHYLLGGEPWVDGGQEWKVTGTIENRTHDKTLEVVMLPQLERNATYGVPIPEFSDPPDADCGIGTLRQLAPGEEVEFHAPVRTSASGATRGTVRYEPEVYVIGAEGERTKLKDDQVLVTTGSGEHTVRVDTRDRPPEVAGVGELLYIYGSAAIDEFSTMVGSMAWMALEAIEFGLSPWEWPEAYRAAGDKVSEYVLDVYENLSPSDKAAWHASWISAAQSATGMALVDARNLVDQMALESFTQLSTAWETGDYNTVAAWWGKQTGAAPDLVLGGLVKGFGVCKLVSKSTPWARRALLAKEAQLAARVEALGAGATVHSFPTGGIINRIHRRTLWGIDDVMNDKVQRFVDRFGVAIGVRRRGPGSIAKIEAGTHYGKVYHNKAKNIADTDVQWMKMVDDLDTSAIKQPPPISEIRQALAGADETTVADVLSRHKTRNKEWYGKGPDPKADPAGYEAWLEDGTGADFTKSERYKWGHYAHPDVGMPVPHKGGPLDYPDGRPQMILEIDYGDGFKPMTGDMDPLVVTKADLSHLPFARRIEFYEQAQELGFEHVESATWENVGRNEYLQEHSVHVENSESMFTWVPKSEPRATRFDPRHTWFHPDDVPPPNSLEAGVIYLRGINVQIKTADPVPGDIDLSDPRDDRVYINPKTIFLVDPGCSSGEGGANAFVGDPDGSVRLSALTSESCPINFDRGPDAIVLRQTLIGELERWTEEDGWQPFSIAAPGELPVLPQTVITAAAAAGESRVEIASESDMDVVAGVDEWFAEGDLVVIDPGGPNEEYVVIGGFGSLIFTEQLTKDHLPGETVTLVKGTDPADPTDPTDPADPTDPTDPADPTDPTSSAVPGVPSDGASSGTGGTDGTGGTGAAAATATVAVQSASNSNSTSTSSAATNSSGSLAYTGTSIAALVALGLAMLLLGFAALGRPGELQPAPERRRRRGSAKG